MRAVGNKWRKEEGVVSLQCPNPCYGFDMIGEGLGAVAADNRVGSVRSGTIQSYPCRLIGGEQTAGRS
ncbi:hypothetical protein GLI01_00440 [Gluconacetobacter liquefaciens]|nr:hypothetical protein GLI01_00440 [Gluconacetobacter liquefaciens]